MTADMYGYLPEEAILRCKTCSHDMFLPAPSVGTKATWTFVFKCANCGLYCGINVIKEVRD